MQPGRPCPCGVGGTYGACCAPLHQGAREAPDAVTLMRSRYAAFATGEIEYLARTLHPDHEDRARPGAQLLADLRRSVESHRYLGLRVLDSQPPDGDGVARVLFLARVFHRGRDRSFVELSDFAHDGVGWRYLSGISRPASAVQGDPGGLTIAGFLSA